METGQEDRRSRMKTNMKRKRETKKRGKNLKQDIQVQNHCLVSLSIPGN